MGRTAAGQRSAPSTCSRRLLTQLKPLTSVLPLALTAVLLVSSASAVPVHKASQAQLSQVVTYFIKFGHTNHTKLKTSDKVGALNTLSNDIKGFQKFAGLKETGELDDATIKKLQEPRCGVKDNDKRTRKTGRRKRWALHGSRWTVRDLTYSIQNAPSSVKAQKYIDDVLGDALNTWARAANVNFKKVSDNANPHIQIKFASGYHNDADPFDGLGGTLAHAYFPIYGGDAHFDDAEPWSINSRVGSNLYVAATHEFGHSLGLSHSNIRSMMSPWYQRPANPKDRNLLAVDDVTAIRMLYGPRPKNRPGPPARDPGPEMRPRGGSGGYGRPRWGSQPRRRYYPSAYNPVYNRPRFHPRPRPRYNPFSYRNTYGFIRRKDPKEAPAASLPTKKGGDRDLCADGRPDAVLSVNGTTYVFRGGRYWRLTATGVAAGYPRLITSGWDGVAGPLDAALFSRARNRIYLFKGDQVWVLSSEYLVLAGYPRAIAKEFPGTVEKDLSAAFEWGKDSQLYLVKGDKFWKVGSSGGSKPLSQWSGLPRTIDAATQYSNGKTYFFSGQNYYRFDDAKFKVDDSEEVPFPRATGKFWFDCPTK